MKKYLALILAALIIGSSLCGCGTKSFSYDDDFTSLIEREVGIKTRDFKNTEEKEIKSESDALKLALKEVEEDYSNSSVYFDEQAKIWKVEFYNKKDEGKRQIVYLYENGKTKLCAFEE